MKTILTLAIMVFVISCVDINQDKQIQDCTEKIDSLERVINDKESDIEVLINEIDTRESEISYLGHSLDSLKNK